MTKKKMRPKFVIYTKYFCAFAVAASILFDYVGLSTGYNFGASSAVGAVGLGVVKNYAILA